jgi:hypothetical protein
VQAQTRAGLLLRLARAVVDLSQPMPHPSRCRQSETETEGIPHSAKPVGRRCPLSLSPRTHVVRSARGGHSRECLQAHHNNFTTTSNGRTSLCPISPASLAHWPTTRPLDSDRLHNRPSPVCARSSLSSHSPSHCYCHYPQVLRIVANHTRAVTASSRPRAIQICSPSQTTLWPLWYHRLSLAHPSHPNHRTQAYLRRPQKVSQENRYTA